MALAPDAALECLTARRTLVLSFGRGAGKAALAPHHLVREIIGQRRCCGASTACRSREYRVPSPFSLARVLSLRHPFRETMLAPKRRMLEAENARCSCGRSIGSATRYRGCVADVSQGEETGRSGSSGGLFAGLSKADGTRSCGRQPIPPRPRKLLPTDRAIFLWPSGHRVRRRASGGLVTLRAQRG